MNTDNAISLQILESITDPDVAREFAVDAAAFAALAACHAEYCHHQAYGKDWPRESADRMDEAREKAPSVLSVAEAIHRADEAKKAQVSASVARAKRHAQRDKDLEAIRSGAVRIGGK